MRIFTTLLFFLPLLGFSQTTNLIISEYGEGAPGNKKYIEIYNGTGASIDLSNFQLWKSTNGGLWTGNVPLSLTGMITNGEAYVIANNATDVTGADLYNVFANWNGDDAVGLAWNGGSGTTFTLLDAVGYDGTDPGTGFTVAGILNATVDKVMIRKASVCSPTTDWTVSAGTDVATSQWIVSTDNYSAGNTTVLADLGIHTANCAAPCATLTAPVAPAVSICMGATATLAATASETGSTLTWYDVATSGTALSTGTNYQTTALNATTSYWVDETVTGCPPSPRTEVVVTVNNLPTVDAGIDQIVCTGANVTLSGAGASTYAWDNSVTNGVAFPAAATTTYTVTGTDLNGCTDTDQVTVTVSGSAPTANAGTDQTVCAGTSVSLTATGTGTFSWDNGVQQAAPFTATATTTYTVTVDNGTCTNTDQVTIFVDQPSVAGTASVSDVDACLNDVLTGTVTGQTGTVEWFVQAPGMPMYMTAGTGASLSTSPVPAAGSYNVKAQVTNGACPMVTTNIVVVVVNALPTVNGGTDQSVCAGSPVTLNATGAVTYVWNNSVTNNTPFTPTGTATYTVTGTDTHGCTDNDDVVVTVTPLPTVNAGADQTVCEGESVTLNGGGATTYSWNNGVTNGTAFTPTATTTYTVTGATNGCTNTDQVIVTVNTAPVATTTLSGATITAAPAGMTYQWNNCTTSQPIAGATNATYTATANGSYSVEVTNPAGCSSTSACVNITTLGLEETKADLNVTLYPNPTKGKVTLSMSSNDHVNVTVYNALGKVVSTISNAQNGTVIDLSTAQAGVYMIQVAGEKGSSIYRIVRN